MYCVVEIKGQQVRVKGMQGEYDTIVPEDVEIEGRMWNGVSIEPRISSWKNEE